jgi:hypothetical protein
MPASGLILTAARIIQRDQSSKPLYKAHDRQERATARRSTWRAAQTDAGSILEPHSAIKRPIYGVPQSLQYSIQDWPCLLTIRPTSFDAPTRWLRWQIGVRPGMPRCVLIKV